MKVATTGFVQVVDPPKERGLEWGFELRCEACEKVITEEHFGAAIFVDKRLTAADGRVYVTRRGPFHKDCGEEFSKQVADR